MISVHDFIELSGTGAELAGVALIAGGAVLAALRAAWVQTGQRFERFRRDLGRAILLGLELLVAADIVRTVAFTPTMDSVLVLALIVAIRTFLSWSLALEIEGRWPWQKKGETP